MTTLIPRDPYTAEEIAVYYPPGLELKQVQIVSQIDVIVVSHWLTVMLDHETWRKDSCIPEIRRARFASS